MRYFLAALCAVVLSVCVCGAISTTTVTYNVALPGGTYPATLVATATVTWVSSGDPAILNRPIAGTYSASAGTVTWTLPQNSQVRFTCVPTGLNEVVALGTSASYTLNSLTAVSAPATQPAWAGNYLLRDGTNTMTGDLTFEGTTADAYEGVLDPGDPTSDWLWTFPNKSGTVAMTSDIAAEVDPRLPAHSTSGNLLTSNGSAWTSAAPTFLPLAGGTMTGNIDITNANPQITVTYSGAGGAFGALTPDHVSLSDGANTLALYRGTLTADAEIYFPSCTGTAWADCNDGTGSGLDADTVDGSHAAAFALSAAGVPTPANPGDDNKLLKASGGAFSWQTIPADGDSVVGNEITNVSGTTLTRSGTGTGGDPYLVALNTGNANTWTAAQMIEGSADAVQLTVRGHSTQTSPLFTLETDAGPGTDVFTVSNTGAVTAAGTATAGTASATDTVGVVAQNTDNPDSGETTQAVSVNLNVMSTSDGGSTYVSTPAARIIASKSADFFNAAGGADNDANLAFTVARNGSYQTFWMYGTGGFSAPGTITAGTNISTGDTYQYTWLSGDTGLSRPAAGVVKVTNGSTGNGRIGAIGFVPVSADLTADDVTPDVSTATVWKSVANGGATAITDLDNPVVGAFYTIICGSATNPISIADGAPFSLTGAWAPDSVGDNIVLYVNADNDYYEISRANN